MPPRKKQTKSKKPRKALAKAPKSSPKPRKSSPKSKASPKSKKASPKPKKSSELDSVLSEVSDSTVADAKKELQSLLADAKGDSASFFQKNAEKLEQRLVLVSKGELDEDDFDFFVEEQKRAAQIFIDSQPPQAQERAEKLTLHLLDVAATKIVPVLIAMI